MIQARGWGVNALFRKASQKLSQHCVEARGILNVTDVRGVGDRDVPRPGNGRGSAPRDRRWASALVLRTANE